MVDNGSGDSGGGCRSGGSVGGGGDAGGCCPNEITLPEGVATLVTSFSVPLLFSRKNWKTKANHNTMPLE